MEENKQETIVKLYSLRAGLSLLSQIRDEAKCHEILIQENEREINYLKREQGKLRDKIEECNSTIEYKQNCIKTNEKDIINYNNSVASALNEREIRLKTISENIIKWWRTLFISIMIGVLPFLLALLFAEGLQDSLYPLLGISMAIIVSIVLTFVSSKKLSTYRSIYREISEEISNPDALVTRSNPKDWNERRNKEYAAEIELCEENRKECQAKFSEKQNEIDSMRKEITLANEKIPPIIERFNVAYKAVQEQFAGFIDERDWGNVDLIIFNYETGRALDFRDALLQVDNERRNERLVKAVRDASSAISSSIIRGFGALQHTLQRQTALLDSRITELSNTMLESNSRQMAAIAESNQAMLESSSRQIAALTESNRAQQALLDKMKTSSDVLASDIHHMRELADKTYYNY